MRKLSVLFVAVLMFVGVNAYALEHEFTVGPEISHITYKEPDVMTEKGWFYGIAGKYTLKIDVAKDWKIAVGPELKLAKGSVDYSSPISGNMDGIDDVLFEARLIAGPEWKITPEMTLKPYTGFGYRSLVDDSQGMKTDKGAWGYKRWIRYYYIPVGVSYTYEFAKDWKGNVYAEYDFFVRGKVTSYLGYLPGYEDIKNTQKSGYGLRAGINVEKKFTSWGLSFGPYVKYWNVKDSEVAYDSLGRGWLEPRNHSTEVGGALTVSF
ncbi:hypothetical protein V4D30_01835 [Thermodesulfovibrio sp. 3907-1M]|uniref:MipA/OmpV family protein n=1 Tax=Thermodesulfovibrio autotrophicus TaxID=3118333 RepID=A0AAU8H069_9BACT